MNAAARLRMTAPARRVGLPPPVVPVSVLVSQARLLLERQLALTWISGEVSAVFQGAASGHCYFKLKDAQAQVRCVMYRLRDAARRRSPCATACSVEVRATPSLYEPRGEFQLNVDALRLAGVGALYERFARLKARLEADGLVRGRAQAPAARVPARRRHRHVAARRCAARRARPRSRAAGPRCAS